MVKRTPDRLPPAPGSAEIYTLAEEETFAYGEALGRSLKGGELILLQGELGAGKTVFARGIAAGLEIDPANVGSPTFILMDRYEGRLTLYHADLYRLDSEDDMFDLALDEFAATGAVVVVEWGERLGDLAPGELLEIVMTFAGDDERAIEFVAYGERFQALIEELKRAYSSN